MWQLYYELNIILRAKIKMEKSIFFPPQYIVVEPEIATRLINQMMVPAKISATGDHAMIDATISLGVMPNVHLWHSDVRTGIDLELLSANNRLVIYFPGEGVLEVYTSTDNLICNSLYGVCVEDTDISRVRFNLGRSGVGMAIDRTALTLRLEALLERSLTLPLAFAPRFEVAKPQRTAVTELVYAVTTPTLGVTLMEAPAIASQLATTMIDLVLQSLPHNYSADLAKEPPPPAPRHIKRALSFIDANLSRGISVDELAHASGVSMRALYYGFRQFLGVSPAEYIRNLRLRGARQLLIDGEAASLSTLARDWGFTNVSRFNQLLKANYGETASELRRRLMRLDPHDDVE